jgi:hypothetical protein
MGYFFFFFGFAFFVPPPAVPVPPIGASSGAGVPPREDARTSIAGATSVTAGAGGVWFAIFCVSASVSASKRPR